MKELRKIKGRPADLPALGTKEAALKGCVDLIARMCGKPAPIVSLWLDLYFQTRLAYAMEEEQRRRELKLIDRLPLFFGTPGEKRQDSQEEAPAPVPRAECEATTAAEPVQRDLTPPPQ